ncbi:nucleotidyltransferase family protein [Paenisporosarcina sp. NPDC076898]|uniref:nucleotidyltransferase family protein n=1 Tax=unclassified Paenisporosarcina TaxID=2642018 RepID=UPI003D08D949
MKLSNEQDIVKVISIDGWMMKVIRQAATLGLPDWWICAGLIRAKVWDELHGFSEKTILPDVDVIYFDSKNTDEYIEKFYEKELMKLDPTIPWSVKNQARMHKLNKAEPYTSSMDGMLKFPETATAIGISLDEKGELRLCAPYGVTDLLTMKICPTPFFNGSQIYFDRLKQKNWSATWRLVNVE